MSVTMGDLAKLQALIAVPEQRCISSWRCARCDREPGTPVTWLWRNDTYGTALVTCPSCKWKWQEPGWRCVDGVWADNDHEVYGIGDGYAKWSKFGPTQPDRASHDETDDSEGIDDSDDDHLTR